MGLYICVVSVGRVNRNDKQSLKPDDVVRRRQGEVFEHPLRRVGKASVHGRIGNAERRCVTDALSAPQRSGVGDSKNEKNSGQSNFGAARHRLFRTYDISE